MGQRMGQRMADQNKRYFVFFKRMGQARLRVPLDIDLDNNGHRWLGDLRTRSFTGKA